MFAPEMRIFVQVPEESAQRILHPFSVVGSQPGGISIRSDDEGAGLNLLAGAEVRIFFERKQKFVQQAARVDAVLATDAAPIVGIQLIGDAVSADSRECYRVSTLSAGIAATLDGEEGRLADVSVTGLSVIMKRRHGSGKVIPVSVQFDGRKYTGMTSVQSVKDLDKGFVRYGLSCLDSKKSDAQLPAGLHKISMAVQRTQLKRMAGVA